jgi:hypothetical protein
MIARYLIALVGALAITIGMFLFMDDIAERYVMRDPIRYFRIMDVISAPDRSRERVEAPRDPRLAPAVPQLEFDPLREAPAAPDGGIESVEPPVPPAEAAEPE